MSKENAQSKAPQGVCSTDLLDALYAAAAASYDPQGEDGDILVTLHYRTSDAHHAKIVLDNASNAKADLPAIAGKVRRVVGQIICPECGVFVDSADVCVCGYEHQCGGSAESCRVPGCAECGMPNSGITGK